MIFLCFITCMIEHSTRNFPCHIKIYFTYDVPVHEHIIRKLTIEHGFESVEIKCKQKLTCSYQGNRRAKTYSPLSFSIFVYCSVSSLLGIHFRTSHVRMFLLLDAIFFSILKLTLFFQKKCSRKAYLAVTKSSKSFFFFLANFMFTLPQ